MRIRLMLGMVRCEKLHSTELDKAPGIQFEIISYRRWESDGRDDIVLKVDSLMF